MNTDLTSLLAKLKGTSAPARITYHNDHLSFLLAKLKAGPNNDIMAPGDALKIGIKALLKTDKFSDLVIKSGDRDFNVHKVLLYSQSSYFRAALEGNFEEAKTNVITLPEPENVIQALIHYMYASAWDESARGDTPKPVFCVYVYQVADKYDVPDLARLAASRLAAACDHINDVPNFIDTIYAIDECTHPKDRKLWNVVLPMIKKNMVHLLTFDDFKELIKEKDELNFELLSQLYAEKSLGEEDTYATDGSGGRKLGGGRATIPRSDGW